MGAFFIASTRSLRYKTDPRRTAMAKKKGKVRVITLECTEARKEGKPVSRYTTMKNTQTHPERMEKMKYNPNLRRHTNHKEIK